MFDDTSFVFCGRTMRHDRRGVWHVVIDLLAYTAITALKQCTRWQLSNALEHRMWRRHPANREKGIYAVDIDAEAWDSEIQETGETVRNGDRIIVFQEIRAGDTKLVSCNCYRAAAPIEYHGKKCSI